MERQADGEAVVAELRDRQEGERAGLDQEGAVDRPILRPERIAQAEGRREQTVEVDGTTDLWIEEISIDLVKNAVNVHRQQHQPADRSEILVKIICGERAARRS
jgi:hypothetical protein